MPVHFTRGKLMQSTSVYRVPFRQNARVDRAAANQVTTSMPPVPRLRVQRFVRALGEHRKEVRVAALSVISRRGLGNSFRESGVVRMGL